MYVLRKHKHVIGIVLIALAIVLLLPEMMHITGNRFSWYGEIEKAYLVTFFPTGVVLLVIGILLLALPLKIFVSIAWCFIPFAIAFVIKLTLDTYWSFWWSGALLGVPVFIFIVWWSYYREFALYRASCPMPVLLHQYWVLEDMIDARDNDPDVLRTFFAEVNKNPRLDYSWKEDNVLYVQVKESREELSLVEVSLDIDKLGTSVSEALMVKLDSIIDTSTVNGTALFIGACVRYDMKHVQLLFNVDQKKEKRMIRWFNKKLHKCGFEGSATALTAQLRKNSEEPLFLPVAAIERCFIAARSGMFSWLGFKVEKPQEVFIQMLFSTREAAEAMMNEQRGYIFPLSGYWEKEEKTYMVVFSTFCDLKVKSIEREYHKFSQYDVAFIEVATVLDTLYENKQDFDEAG